MSELGANPPELLENPESTEKKATMPVEVIILTRDHEIRGIVHVSRKAKEDRRISDLLNDARRRFLAVTDAELLVRSAPSSPRHYSFLQLHIDNIIMIHPSTQTLVNKKAYTPADSARFQQFREKVNKKTANA